MKEEHCDTAGLSKNGTKWVFRRCIDCTYFSRNMILNIDFLKFLEEILVLSVKLWGKFHSDES